MSKETLEWLNRNVLVGFTDKRGTAWHYRASDQGTEPNHYRGAIPAADVQRRLFAWEALEAPLTATLPGTSRELDVRRKAIVRSDTGDVLGVVGEGYRIHGYREWLLDNVFGLLGEVGIGSAGILEGGARAWVQVEVPENIQGPGGVEFRPFLAATTSLDGSSATYYLTGAQVIVCDNTLRAALTEPDARKLRVLHLATSEFGFADARQALGVLEATGESFVAEVRAQQARRVSDDQWRTFLRAHFPLSNEDRVRTHPQFERRAAVDHLYCHDERVAPWAGSAYGVLAAVNTYEHHLAEGRPGRTRPERNALRVMDGRLAKADLRAMKTLDRVLQSA